MNALLDPLTQLLPQLIDLPQLLRQVTSTFAGVGKAIDSLRALSDVQNEVKNTVRTTLDSLRAISTTSSAATVAAAASPTSIIDRLEGAMNEGNKLQQFQQTLTTAVSRFSKSSTVIYDMFRALEQLLLRLVSVPWRSLIDLLQKIQQQYQPWMEQAKKILLPSGFLAIFLKPSAYLDRVTSSVEEIRDSLDLDGAGSALQSSLSVFESVFGVTLMDASGGAKQNAQETRDFLSSAVTPLREKLDAVLMVNRLQTFALGTGTDSLQSVASADVSGLVAQYTQTFALQTQRQVAERALSEANRLKEQAMQELSNVTQQLTSQAEQFKQQLFSQSCDLRDKLDKYVRERV
jgi:hypothetical protein